MKQKTHRLLSLLLCLVMVLGLMPMTAFAGGTREEVDIIKATAIINVPSYGEPTNYPTFTVTEGSPAYIATMMTRWEKKNTVTGNWDNVDSGNTFTEGTWRLSVQVRIDGEGSKTHKLSAKPQFFVNEVEWQIKSGPLFAEDQSASLAFFHSQEYEVTSSTLPQMYDITVTNGVAKNESYIDITKAKPGDKVVLLADDRRDEGLAFEKWVVTGATVDAENNMTAKFIMPEGNVTAKATYIPCDISIKAVKLTLGNYAVGKKASDISVKITTPGVLFSGSGEGSGEYNQGYQIAIPDGELIDGTITVRFLEPDEKLEAGADYDLFVFVKAADGSTLKDLTAANAKLDGKAAEAVDLLSDGVTAVIIFKLTPLEASHTHTYGTEWKSDAYKHWHECSCGAKSKEAAHTASDWITDTPATATTSGTKHKECTVCGYTMATETIPATGGGEHTHSYGSEWKNDADNHWHECSCGDKKDTAAHTAGEWIIDTPATATTSGTKHKECTVCHRELEIGTIPATGYTITFDANDGTGTMADVTGVSGEYTLPANGFTAPAGKQFKAWSVGGVEKAVGDKITVTANTTVTAVWEAIEYNVTVTDGTASVGAGTPITKATMGTAVTLTANAAPSNKVFDKWEVVSGGITLADANSATTTFTMPASAVSVKATYKNAPHTHTYNQETVKPEALKTPADCTSNAVYFKSCSCGAISTTDTFVAMNTALGHAYGSDWKYDSTNHWHECSRCHDKKDEAAHDYGSDNVCDTCGYDKTVPHTHNLTLVAAKAATCTTAGNSAYYTCDGCDKWFADAAGSVEITDKTSVKIPAPGHTAGTEWKSDDTNHWYKCTVAGCGVIIESTKSAHTAGEWIIDTPATATTSGSKHKECTVCGYTMATETIPATGGGYYYAPTAAVVPDMPMLYRGCTGDAVKTLQDKLNALGYNSGNVDGIFGAKTYAAVTAFQKANSLGVDGIVGKLTWGKLYGVSPAMPVETTTVVGRPMVSYGSRGDAVRKLQELLNALGYDCGSVDGIFGSKTKAAVLAFQKANGLAADGIVGPLTWGKLV